MVMQTKITRDRRKWAETAKGLRVVTTNVSNRAFNSSYEQAEELMSMMATRIMEFEDTEEIRKGLVINVNSKDNKSNSISLRSTAPNSLFNEFGVKEHWVNINKVDDPMRFAKWQEKNIGGAREFMLIGGPNSRIQKGNSQNQFFRISIETFVRGNTSQTQYIKALREGLKKSFK